MCIKGSTRAGSSWPTRMADAEQWETADEVASASLRPRRIRPPLLAIEAGDGNRRTLVKISKQELLRAARRLRPG